MIDITANFFLCTTLKRKEQLVTSQLELFKRQAFLDFLHLPEADTVVDDTYYRHPPKCHLFALVGRNNY